MIRKNNINLIANQIATFFSYLSRSCACNLFSEGRFAAQNTVPNFTADMTFSFSDSLIEYQPPSTVDSVNFFTEIYSSRLQGVPFGNYETIQLGVKDDLKIDLTN